MRCVVYDLECMCNLFTYTDFNRSTNKYTMFTIHKLKNDLIELVDYLLQEQTVMIGFNNLNYDYPLLHHLLNHFEEYKYLSSQVLTEKLYSKSQEIINMDFSEIEEKNVKIPQIDVYKINHWDNPGKATSLKHCEMAMRMDNIEEMPLHHTHWVTKQEEIDLILNYNKHDVKATNEVFNYCIGDTNHSVYKNKNKIALRQLLSKTFNLNLLNANDVKIGEVLVGHLYKQGTQIPNYIFKKLRTPRKLIYLKDCIPDYIYFKTPLFQNLLKSWKQQYITTTKDAISDSIVYHDIKLDYGTGGIHGSKSGIFNEDDDYFIIDADVGSLYPSIIVNNKYYPEHLGEYFLELYKGFVDTRLNEKKKPKKERNAVIMEGYKLMVNGIKYLKF